jgi:tetratricopeptide (TPR) repeat protein
MPARTHMGVDARRDHAFAVPRPDLAVALGTPEPCASCHPGRGPAWAAGVVAAWRGPDRPPPPHFAPALDAGRRGRRDAGRRLAALAADAGQAAIVRATALGLLPPYLTPASAPVVEAALDDRDPLVRAAALGAAAALPAERLAALAPPALRDPVRAVRVAAVRALAGARPALGPEGQAALDAALPELIASELASGDRPEAHLNLATVYGRLGRPAEAEAALRTALRLDPGFVPALLELADLLRRHGRPAEGERALDDALALAPDDPEALHALGLLRVRQGRRAEAVPLLGRAAALRPDAPRLAYVHALALHATGDVGGAIATLEAAHARRPADREVLVALVAYARERGDLARALRHAESLAALLPDDPGVQALRDGLRGEAGGARPGP